ncbi:hypothetical protein [Clostridium sp.]
MKEIQIPYKKFNITEFMEKMEVFTGEVMNVCYAFPWVEVSGDIPDFDEDKEERDYISELKDEGKLLYFTFSNTNIGEPINCADGEEYEIDEDSNFCLGDADTVGYLLQYKNGDLIINSAVNAAGACTATPPSLDIELNCDVVDKPMEEFIQGFIEK